MMVDKADCFNDQADKTMNDDIQPATLVPHGSSDRDAAKPLSDAARRALAEAEERRRAYRAAEAAMPKEVGGRGGKEPVRYGDWEIKGLASDF